jgi:hypothetical protein
MITQHRHDLSDSKEFFFIGISLLEQNAKTNMIPELVQILQPHQIILLSQVFNGRSVKFPSSKELSTALKASLYIYYSEVEGKADDDIAVVLDATDHELKVMKEYKRQWETSMRTELGNDFYSAIRG